jgi:hypothetical protein
MEEILWYTKQQSRLLQEFRQEIQGFWDDEAARDINMRYLNPHQDDDKGMMDGFQGQSNALEEAKVKLSSANEHALQATKLSQEVAELLESTQQEVDIAHQFEEQYQEHHSIARSLLPQIAQSITLANSVCDGVATQ